MPLDKVYIGESPWEQFQRAKTEHQLKRCRDEFLGMMIYGQESEEERYRFKWLAQICIYRLANGLYDPEINARGNTVIRRWRDDYEAEDRYKFDWEICTPELGWEQYDTSQDAWYFGVWVNIKERRTLTYAEGDVTIVECPDDAHLQAELDNMAKFYGPAPPAMIACDSIGLRNGKLAPEGNVVGYYTPRPEIPTQP